MGISYNRIAGQSVERLAAPSDGIFAVAMTLMFCISAFPPPKPSTVNKTWDAPSWRSCLDRSATAFHSCNQEHDKQSATAQARISAGLIDFGLDAGVECAFPVGLRRVLGGRHVNVLGG